MDDKTTTTEISRLIDEIDETKRELKTIREQLRDALDQNEEYRAAQTETETLATKRAEARKMLLDDRDYQKINAELEDTRFKLRDLNEILSHHLIEHYSQTQKTEVTDATGTTRPVILSAKLGRADGGIDGSTA